MMLEAQAVESVAVISRIAEQIETLTVPTFESFIQPTELSQQVTTKWEVGELINSTELKCQVNINNLIMALLPGLVFLTIIKSVIRRPDERIRYGILK